MVSSNFLIQWHFSYSQTSEFLLYPLAMLPPNIYNKNIEELSVKREDNKLQEKGMKRKEFKKKKKKKRKEFST